MAAIAHRDVAGVLRERGYSEVKQIGEGSFGKALLVQSTADNSKLVCKMVDISKASKKEQEAALREGKLLSQLKHPYIVRYRESFTRSGWLCIVMDYCQGGDLAKQISQAKKSKQLIPEEKALRWFTQAMMALKHIHGRKILHRDLKPSNFFLSRSGAVKMGDFGIAKVLACTMACARTQIGTPYYLSPEVCQERPYTWPSDIWAMGCILFELCASKVPFDAPSISALMQKIVRGPLPVLPSTTSEFVRSLCGEMLSRSTASRPSTDDILRRSKIQSIVRQMLEELQANSTSPGAEVLAEQAAEVAAVAAAPPAPRAAPHENPGTYRKGDLVEYYSSTHKDWLPAKVIDYDSSTGSIIIDLKQKTWLTMLEQSTKIRPRQSKQSAAGAPATPSAAPAVPSAAAASQCGPNRVGGSGLPVAWQRSPSVDAVLERRGGNGGPGNASPMRHRSPSVDALPRQRPPRANSPSQSPAPAGPRLARGRDASPRRLPSAERGLVADGTPRSATPSGNRLAGAAPCRPPRVETPRPFGAAGAAIAGA